MSTITPAAGVAVASPFNTSPAYSGTFIPAVWAAKLNQKFYMTSTFADVCNTDWEGDVKAMGDKVVINIRTFFDGHRPPDRVLPSRV